METTGNSGPENYETLSLISSFKSEENERLLVSLDETRVTDSMTCFGLFSMPMFAKYPYVDLWDFQLLVALRAPHGLLHIPKQILSHVKDEKLIQNVFFTVQTSPAAELNYLPHTWCFLSCSQVKKWAIKIIKWLDCSLLKVLMQNQREILIGILLENIKSTSTLKRVACVLVQTME
jgi:hypothetical protein